MGAKLKKQTRQSSYSLEKCENIKKAIKCIPNFRTRMLLTKAIKSHIKFLKNMEDV